jgi:hypothetical protein
MAATGSPTARRSALRSAAGPASRPAWGSAPTKTLAKLANRLAKAVPELHGVCDPTESGAVRDRALAAVAVDAVWGIGPALAGRLPANEWLGARAFRQHGVIAGPVTP